MLEQSILESADFEVSGVRKDLQAIVGTAQDFGVAASVAASALAQYAGASASGFGDQDLVHIVDYAAWVAHRTVPRNPAG